MDRCGDLDTIQAARLLIAPRWPSGLLRLMQSAPPGYWLYTGGLENHPRLVDRLAQIQPLAGNQGNELREARSLSVLASGSQRKPACKFPQSTSVAHHHPGLGTGSGSRAVVRAVSA
jgi:hypothetical protein